MGLIDLSWRKREGREGDVLSREQGHPGHVRAEASGLLTPCDLSIFRSLSLGLEVPQCFRERLHRLRGLQSWGERKKNHPGRQRKQHPQLQNKNTEKFYGQES